MQKMKSVIPCELLIPLGARATKELGKCCDNWSDSEIAVLRAELPQQYHAVPLDYLRRQWINIRKKGTEGYRLGGTGPSKGSRKKTKMKASPSWYLKYLDSPTWKERRLKWLDYWEHKCSVCNASESEVQIDVHHRTYERLHSERDNDCTVLCRRCHEIFHAEVEVEKTKMMF